MRTLKNGTKLFTEKELVKFGQYLLSEERTDRIRQTYNQNDNISLSERLQDYKHNEEFNEGCMTFTLSRRLEKQEREEFKSDWETERIMIQFHTQKKLF